jgi:hypothetical protein
MIGSSGSLIVDYFAWIGVLFIIGGASLYVYYQSKRNGDD